MKKNESNVFNKGLNADYGPYNTPKDIYIDSLNSRLVTYDGNEFLMQPAEGNFNECKFNLPDGYVALGVKSYLGIAYIISHNPVTGKGQIGTFPSPAYYAKESIVDSLINSTATVFLTPQIPEPTLFFIKAEITVPTTITIELISQFTAQPIEVFDITECGEYRMFYKGDGGLLSQLNITTTSPANIKISKSTQVIEGDIVKEYSPLQNYLLQPAIFSSGLDNPFDYPAFYASFDTELLGLDLGHPVKIEIQPSYDGTVNLIFTDNLNSGKIVNSRFTITEGDRFKIIDRVGTKDENLYDDGSFGDTLNLFLKSNQIVDVKYEGQKQGGVLKPGNYRYYFRYATQDGNTTDVIEESSLVSVFIGNTVDTLRGGLEGEITNKLVRFTLDNLDQAFTYVKVYFTYNSGESSSVVTAYEISKKYLIPKLGKLTIDHSGYEVTLDYDLSILSLDTNGISTFKTMIQRDNRLFIGNIKEREYDRELFKGLSESMRLRSYESLFLVDGVEDVNDRTLPFTSTVISQNHGYKSDINIYRHLGYWGAESYPFGVVYVLEDGSLSDVFPVTGLDDRYVGLDYSDTPTYDNGGWDISGDPNTNLHYGQNIKGVYRFPTRRNSPQVMLGGGVMTVLGIEFRLPDNILSTPEYLDAKEKAIGLFFVRGERVKDCIIQGYVLPCYSVATKQFGEFDTNFYGSGVTTRGESNWRYLKEVFNITSGFPNTEYPEPTSLYWDNPDKLRKVVPLVYGFIEGVNHIPVSGSDVNDVTLINLGEWLRDPYKYGFVSGDMTVAPGFYSEELNGRQLFPYSLLEVKGNSTLIYDSILVGGGTGKIPSLFHTVEVGTPPIAGDRFDKPSTGKYVVPDFSGFNGSFSSKIDKIRLEILTSNTFSDVLNLSFGDYLGLEFLDITGPENIFRKPTWGTPRDGQNIPEYESIVNIAQLINLYPQFNPIATEFIKERYRPEDISYFPITKRMTFDEFEGKLIDYGTYKSFGAYGGDCFLGHSYKKMTFGGELEGLIDPNLALSLNTGNGLSMFHEHNNNPNLRSKMNDFSFFPYEAKGKKYQFFRHDRNPESQNYNAGYSVTKGDKVLVSPDFNLPFIGNRFDTRIMFSQIYVNNSFANGYRVFEGINFEDYSRHLGPIVEMVNLSSITLVVQEHGVMILPISERIETANPQGGTILVENPYILPLQPNVKYISEEYGSQWQSSLIKSNNLLYGVDVDKGKIWQFTGQALEVISDFRVNSILKDIIPFFRTLGSRVTIHDIKGYFIDNSNRIGWSFYIYPEKAVGLPYQSKLVEKKLNLVYNEAMSLWESKDSYYPSNFFNISDKFYTFNSQKEYNKLWEHGSLPYYTFYGDEYSFEIEFVVTGSPYDHKLFTNLVSVCNKHVPVQVVYKNDHDDVTQDLIYRANGNIIRFNARYKEDHLYIVIPTSGNKVIRDKYLRIRFIYTGGQATLLHSVVTEFLNSAS